MKEFFGTKKGVLLINFLKYLLFFACFYLFSIGGIGGEIFPFAFGFFVALAWCDQNVFIIGALFTGASVLASFNVQSLITSLFCIGVMIIVMVIHKKFNKVIPIWLLAFYAIFSQSAYIYFHLTSVNQVLPTIIYLVIGEIFMFACINILKALLTKGFGYKLTIDQIVCLCTFLTALGAGLASANIYGFLVINVVAVFLILFCTYVYNSSSVAIIVATCLGLGYALQTGSVIMICVYCAISLCSVAFKSTNKYFSVMAIIICDVMLGLYFNAYPNYSYKVLICTILGELLFLAINSNTLLFIRTVFGEKNGTVALRAMVNRSRDNLCKKMYNLSEVFDEMDRSFKSTIRGLLPAPEAKQMLKEELINKVCYDCPEKHRCHRVLERETNETINTIISAGLDRGKVTLLDIPPFLSSRCNKTNIILSTLNTLLASYKQYTYCVSSIDTSKALIAEEFRGVSKLLQKLADQTKELVTFDEDFEQKLIEELGFVNIQLAEAYVYEKDGKTLACTLTIKNGDLQNNNLFNTLSKNFGRKMALISSEPSGVPGFQIANFAEAPRLECIFGSSGANKFNNSVSGDSYSYIRLPGNKILLAVCDGMGSGKEAQKMSDTTISLIENFYKADFDDETILSSVNKLLSMQMTDNFSALDICVLDLSNAFADFIKVGAPAGFVKHKDNTEIIFGSGALPIGILKEVSPSINKKALEPNDIIILCSDGVIDAFNDENKLQNYINNLVITNPQEIADLILQEAISLNNNEPSDDMTVLVSRLFLNI